MKLILGFILGVVILTYFAEQGGIVNSADLETNIFRAFREDETEIDTRETRTTSAGTQEAIELRELEREIHALEREIERLRAN